MQRRQRSGRGGCEPSNRCKWWPEGRGDWDSPRVPWESKKHIGSLRPSSACREMQPVRYHLTHTPMKYCT